MTQLVKRALSLPKCASLRWFGIAAAAAMLYGSCAVADTLPVAGAELFYADEGDGSVVLFLHGAVSDHRVWEAIRGHVVAEHRFVAYDQRYFGPADWGDAAARFSVETHVEDLAAVINALDAGPVHLVTWSYGGLVGLHAALRHPDLFRSIIHFEPTVEALHRGLSGERAAIAQKAPTFAPMVEALQDGAEKDAVRRLVEAVFRMEAGAADAFAAATQEMWDDNARTLAPFLEAIPDAPAITCDDLAVLAVPTLVVQGSDAYVLDAMMADEIVRCQRNASAMVLEDANHGGPVQRPDAFARILLSFIASNE